MNNIQFQTDDQIGRERFKQECNQQEWCKHIKDSNKKYSHWDNAYSSGNTKMIGEIKIRNYNLNDFESWILQVDKLQNLQKIHQALQKKNINTKITYINHFKNEKTLIWDLTDLNLNDYQIKQEWMQKNDYTNEKELKNIIYLPSNIAIFNNIYQPNDDLKQKLMEQQQEDDEFLTKLFNKK